MWLYPRPSCLDRSFEELSATENNTRIHRVMDHGPVRIPGPALSPWEKGLPTPGLVYLDLFRQLMWFYLFIALMALHRVSGVSVARCGASTCPRMRWSGRRTMPAKKSCGHRKREGKPRVSPVRRWTSGGEDTPTKSESSEVEEEDGEVTLPPLSPLRVTLPRSVISLIGRWGPQPVSNSRNEHEHEQGLGHQPALLSYPT
jgi:hypothetical protein